MLVLTFAAYFVGCADDAESPPISDDDDDDDMAGDDDDDDGVEAELTRATEAWCDRFFECGVREWSSRDECVDFERRTDPVEGCEEALLAYYGCLEVLSCEDFAAFWSGAPGDPCFDEYLLMCDLCEDGGV